MGKKRVIVKEGLPREGAETRASGREDAGHARRALSGIVFIQATYNNTMITVADAGGNTLAWASAGSVGFSGSRKATPYAASRVAEIAAERAKRRGIQEVAVRVSGVGSGRDSAVRSLANNGLNIISIRDVTPQPHNGPRRRKVRRV